MTGMFILYVIAMYVASFFYGAVFGGLLVVSMKSPHLNIVVALLINVAILSVSVYLYHIAVSELYKKFVCITRTERMSAACVEFLLGMYLGGAALWCCGLLFSNTFWLK